MCVYLARTQKKGEKKNARTAVKTPYGQIFKDKVPKIGTCKKIFFYKHSSFYVIKPVRDKNLYGLIFNDKVPRIGTCVCKFDRVNGGSSYD